MVCPDLRRQRSLRFATIAVLTAVACADATNVAGQVEAIFQPLRVEAAALAPDGRHAAFVTRDNDGLHILVRNIDRPDLVTRRLLDGRADVRVDFLRWAGAGRLVVATDASVVVTVDADARQSGLLADPRVLAGRDKDEKAVLVRVAGLDEAGGTATLEVHRYRSSDVVLEAVRADLRTGRRTVLLAKHLTAPGGRLLTDRQGRPRVLLHRGELPQRFDHLAPGAKPADWVPLDRLARDEPAHSFTVTPPTFLGGRSFPLGFGRDPDRLFYAAGAGRDRWSIRALDLRTGGSENVLEDAAVDLADPLAPLSGAALVIDPAHGAVAGVRLEGTGTRWLDAEIAGVESELATKFSGRRAEVLGWDTARRRFLALVTSPQAPGRYFIFHRDDGRCEEHFRQLLLDPDVLNPAEPFAVDGPDGRRITGLLTRPRSQLAGPPALVVWLHDGPWTRTGSGFQPDAQALAAMGFAVVQFDYRGSTGGGLRHALAIRDGFDRVPVEDALAVLDALAGRRAFDPQRVAAVGAGFGGYVALRAAQLHPEVFHCAVALDAPLDPAQYTRSDRGAPLQTPEQRLAAAGFDREFEAWFFQPAIRQDAAVDAQAERFSRPVMLLHDPQNPLSPIGRARRLATALAGRGLAVEFAELPPLFVRGLPVARPPVLRRIGRFLHAHLDHTDGTGGTAGANP